MNKSKIPTTYRTAIWKANEKRCFFCSEQISFNNLEIDHLIAETTSPERLSELIKNLGLEAGFTINDFLNLVPTHGFCNNRKSDTEFSEATLRFYMELWSKKQKELNNEISRLSRQSKNESILTKLAIQVESRDLTINEIVRFLENTTHQQHSTATEPLVITFNINTIEYIGKANLSINSSKDYISLCDQLESNLMAIIRKYIPCLAIQSEASSRDGEEISIRYAFWNFNLQHLDQIDFTPWEIVEVQYFSELYGPTWDELFPRAIIDTYQTVIIDENRCPQCASQDLKCHTYTDYEHDEEYECWECNNCGWTG